MLEPVLHNILSSKLKIISLHKSTKHYPNKNKKNIFLRCSETISPVLLKQSQRFSFLHEAIRNNTRKSKPAFFMGIKLNIFLELQASYNEKFFYHYYHYVLYFISNQFGSMPYRSTHCFQPFHVSASSSPLFC